MQKQQQLESTKALSDYVINSSRAKTQRPEPTNCIQVGATLSHAFGRTDLEQVLTMGYGG